MSENSVAARASRVRARLLFLLLDAISVCAGYGLAEIIYFLHKPPQTTGSTLRCFSQ